MKKRKKAKVSLMGQSKGKVSAGRESKISKKLPIKRDAWRVATGVPGFDELVQGGFPEGSSVLIAGGPGTGKTIFAMQYLVNGARSGEKCLYVSFEQKEKDLKRQADQFGWDVEKLKKSGKLKFVCISVKDISSDTISNIMQTIQKEGIKRLVVDSLSTLVINAPIYESVSGLSVKDVMSDNTIFSPPILGDFITNKFLYGFIDQLGDLGCTSLLVAEGGQDNSISRDTLSEFACDGVVVITFEALGGEFARSLLVRKMRHTKNDEDVHPLEICDKGIFVHRVVS